MNVDTDERTGGSEDNEDTGEDDEDEDMGEDDDDEDTGEGEDTEDTGEGNNETGSGCYILDLRVRGIRVWVRKEYVRIYDYCDRFWNPVEWGSLPQSLSQDNPALVSTSLRHLLLKSIG